MDRKLLFFYLIFFMLMLSPTTLGFASEYKDELAEYYERQMERPDYTTIKAKVIGIPFDDTEVDKPNIDPFLDVRYQHLDIKILNGVHKGKTFQINNTIEMISPYKLIVQQGDVVLLKLTEDEAGEVNNLRLYEISREKDIITIIVLFMLLLVIIGGKSGVKSIFSLLFTALMIGFVFIPLVLKGWNPVVVAIGISIIITGVTLIVLSKLYIEIGY